jgi:alpha-L-fucosidase
VRRLQPAAVIFSDAGPDVRWCGNERGVAGDPNWSAVDPTVVRFPGQSDDAVGPALQHGDPLGSVWRPAEVDVSMRPGWFYHPAQDSAVRSEDNLVELYFTSVGRNAKLLLNVPPTRDGLLHETDVARLLGLHRRLEGMRSSSIPLTRSSWRRTGERTAVGEWSLDSSPVPSVVRLAEPIAGGQRVSRYTLEGRVGMGWQRIAAGTTIGHCRLQRIESVAPIRQLRLRIEDSVAPPEPVDAELFSAV